MMQEEKKLTIALDKLPDGGMLVGHAGDEQILLVRRGSEVFALGAQCTHYQGPLAEGLLVGDTATSVLGVRFRGLSRHRMVLWREVR